MLNRCAVILRPAKPYLEWAAALDESGLMPDPLDEQAVYLLPGLGDGADIDELIAMMFALMFENELEGWHTDEADWPKDRTLAMFKQWFKIEVHSLIHDLVPEPLIDDEMESG